MGTLEVLVELKATPDIMIAEQLARQVILTYGYQSGVDQEFLASALAKQRELGAAGNNESMHAEAAKLGMFSKGETRTGFHGEEVDGQTWNETWYYLASDLVLTGDELVNVDDKEEEIRALLEPLGAEEVRYVNAENWNDGKFNFGPETPTENPGVYRVWIRADNNLAQKLEGMTGSSTQQYTQK